MQLRRPGSVPVDALHMIRRRGGTVAAVIQASRSTGSKSSSALPALLGKWPLHLARLPAEPQAEGGCCRQCLAARRRRFLVADAGGRTEPTRWRRTGCPRARRCLLGAFQDSSWESALFDTSLGRARAACLRDVSGAPEPVPGSWRRRGRAREAWLLAL